MLWLMAGVLCCGLWLEFCVVAYGWSLCCVLWLEFVLWLMVGALCCG